MLFLTGKFNLQLVSDGFGYFTLDRENVSQFAIKGFRPKVGITCAFDQLHVYANFVASLLHAAFEDGGNAELSRDFS